MYEIEDLINTYADYNEITVTEAFQMYDNVIFREAVKVLIRLNPALPDYCS